MSYDWLLSLIFCFALLFPVGYAFAKKVEYKWLFIFASYGAQSAITILLLGAFVPAQLLSMYFVPQLEVAGFLDNLYWLVSIIDVIEQYWFVTVPILLLAMPFFLHKRYNDIFSS